MCGNPRTQTCHFALRPLLRLKTPKLTLAGKMPKKGEGTKNSTSRSKSWGEHSAKPSRKRKEPPQKIREVTKFSQPSRNFGGACHKTSWQPKMNLGSPKRKAVTQRNLDGTLLESWRNLGGTFCGTFSQPKINLPQETIEPFCPETFIIAEDPKVLRSGEDVAQFWAYKIVS